MVSTAPNPNLGYSVVDGPLKANWIAFVQKMRQFNEQVPLSDQFVFHGTSLHKAQSIQRVGMMPTDVSEAVGSHILAKDGSFWGSFEAAVSYAEDTVLERDGEGDPTCDNPPAVIALPIEFLKANFPLVADLATYDFPLDGLTLLDVPEVQTRWNDQFHEMTWEDSLRDLGPLIAIHSAVMPMQEGMVLYDPQHADSFESALLSLDGASKRML